MARLGLFFTFMTDCWYPSRKPKCKSHLWLHRCSPSRPSPPVQMCSLWQQPWLRTVGAGGSVLARSCTSVLVSAPLFCLWGSTSASRCAGDRCWCLGLRSTLLPTLRMNHLSLMTFLAGVGQFLVFFFFFLSVDRKFFSIVPGGFMLQILSAGFSFYWPFFWPPCTGYREGGKSHSRDLWLDCCPCVFTFFYYFCYSGSVLSLSCQMFETRLLGLLNPELTLTF